MTDKMTITRRQGLKLLGAAAAVPGSVLFGPAAAGHDLFARVESAALDFHAKEAAALLEGTYAELFRLRKATRKVESMVHVRFADLGENVRIHGKRDELSRQRFIFNAEIDTYGLGFDVVGDDDPRARDIDSTYVRISDVDSALRNLTIAFQQTRELDAAAILNHAQTYDASIGGDGVCLCSLAHPWDEGTWANTLLHHVDLNHQSLEAALSRIEGFVDDGGERIHVRGVNLVVPPALADIGERAIAGLDLANRGWTAPKLVVWDYLLRQDNWFVTTTVNGLDWYEREPFTIKVGVDRKNDTVVVTGAERRKFTYTDPRAIFGAFPG